MARTPLAGAVEDAVAATVAEERRTTRTRFVREAGAAALGLAALGRLADGTPLAAEKLARVLTNDPAMGVLRHVDAGYDEARTTAAAQDVRIPMAEG